MEFDQAAMVFDRAAMVEDVVSARVTLWNQHVAALPNKGLATITLACALLNEAITVLACVFEGDEALAFQVLVRTEQTARRLEH